MGAYIKKYMYALHGRQRKENSKVVLKTFDAFAKTFQIKESVAQIASASG